eukprot:EG_transcript_12876
MAPVQYEALLKGDAPPPPPTGRDWLNTLGLLVIAAAASQAGSWALRTLVLPPGSVIQRFLGTPQPLCPAVLLTVAAVVAAAAATVAAVLRGAAWIRHEDATLDTGLRRWQVLNVLIYAASGMATTGSSTIRIDAGFGPPRQYSFFLPIPWAFNIWLLIFASEFLFIIYQALPAQRHNAVLALISPYWLLATTFQLLWCFVFCPYAKAVLFLNSAFLAGVAVSLFGAFWHFTSTRAEKLPGQGWGVWLLAQVPLTIHFGWVCAAVLVSSNALLVRFGYPLHPQLLAADLSLVAAAVLGLTLMVARFDAVYGFTLAWAVNGLRAGAVKCLAEACYLRDLPGIPAETLEGLAIRETAILLVLLVVACGILSLKLLRCALRMASPATRDAVLQRLPSPLQGRLA